MTVTIHVFASLREQLGRSSWNETLPDGTDTEALLRHLASRYPEIAILQDVIRIAVNDRWVSTATLLAQGDEVALLTPVSGG